MTAVREARAEDNEVLSLVVEIRARPGEESALEAALRALVPPTCAEDGCMDYALHAAREDPGLFVLYENWATVALWERHMASPHLEAFRSRAESLVAEWRLLRLARLA